MYTKEGPLTPDQQNLVLEWYRYAIKVFRNTLKEKFEFDKEFDIESIIALELCRLARRFDNSRGLKFKTLLTRRISWLRLDLLRSRVPNGFRIRNIRKRSGGETDGVERAHIPSVSQFSQVDDRSSFWEAAFGPDPRDDPVGWEIESIDEVGAIIDGLPPAAREIVRRLYTDASCVRQKDTAKVVGLSEPQLSMARTAALKRLKELLTS